MLLSSFDHHIPRRARRTKAASVPPIPGTTVERLRALGERLAMRTWAIRLMLVLTCALAAHATNGRAEAKFLLVSDVHFNPMADATLVSELAAADPSQWEPILDRTSPGTFSQYKSDTNWWLLKSALKQFPAVLRHPSFVMVTGDLLAHNFPDTFRNATHDTDQQHYRAFVLKTVQFLALQFQRDYPDTRIFITPGNNDNDCGDYTIEAGGAFLQRHRSRRSSTGECRRCVSEGLEGAG